MIRKALPADVSAILDIIGDAKELLRRNNSSQWQDPDGYPGRAVILDDIKQARLYVNIRHNRPAGVVCLAEGEDESYATIDGAWLNDRPYNTIHRLAIKKEFYRQGVAKELIAYAVAAVLSRGLYDLRADTARENVAMNNLLVGSGFIRCGTIRLLRSMSKDPLRVAYHKLLDGNEAYPMHNFINMV